jgi:tRNA-binding protein
MENIKPQISYQDFDKVDIRIGTIIKAEEFKEAIKPAYKVWVDFGKLGVLKSSAQITKNYNTIDLAGKQVCAVVNLGEKQIGPFKSQCLITGFNDPDDEIILATADDIVPNGARLH